MEPQATVLPGQFAVLENSLHLALEVRHDFLVFDGEDPAGQHRVPMIHQSLVLQVVLAEFHQVIGERLALRE